MTSRAEHLPCSGVVVPVLTVLDEKGALIESEQRALVRYVSQDGHGADIVYAFADPVCFVERDVAAALDATGRPAGGVFLYLDDERDPSVPSNGHIRPRLVRSLSRLDFVRGIAATGGRRRLGNYAKAGASSRGAGSFGVYAGDTQQIFDLFRERRGLVGSVTRSWTRRRLEDAQSSAEEQLGAQNTSSSLPR